MGKYGEQFKDLDCIQPIAQFEKYIRHALNYANWASLSKAERLKHEQSRLKIQNDIAKQMNFSHRLVETQQLGQYQDFTMLSARDESDKYEATDNDDLMNSIQAQL